MPTSRPRKNAGRKKKKTQNTQKTRRAPVPTLTGVFTELVRSFRPFARGGSALDAEVTASNIQGTWWQTLPPDGEPDALFGLGAVEYAAGQARPEAMALLCAFAAVGATDEIRTAAAAGADALAAGGVPRPPWAQSIGQVTVGECWRFGDVYGDQASVVCTFDGGGMPHVLIVLIDFNHLGGWVKDAAVSDEPEPVIAQLHEQTAKGDGVAVLERIEPAAARALLEAGFRATDQTFDPNVAEDFRTFRALALARCRAMPDGVQWPAEPPQEITEQARTALVEEFLGSAHAAGLRATPAAYDCARLMVDFGADHDFGKPRRVSPTKTEMFLHEWLPRQVPMGDAEVAAMPAVVTAWARWGAEVNTLPAAAAAELVDAATHCADHFVEFYRDDHAMYWADDDQDDLDDLTDDDEYDEYDEDEDGEDEDDRDDHTGADTMRDGRGAEGRRASQADVYELKVTLLGTDPPIWRRLLVPSDANLAALHVVLQVAFGWENCHLHDFTARKRRYADPDLDLGGDVVDEYHASVRDLLPRVRSRAHYTYDFGDSWEHEIVVEKRLPAGEVPQAVCVSGERAGPPEDCGGVWGYDALCEALADPGKPEHADRLEWLGTEYDPAAFDREAINKVLADLRV